MCRRLTSLAAFAGALVLGGLIAPAFGADGSGTVYIPNPIDDPALHSVVLSGLDGTGFLRGPAADVTNALIPRAQSNTLDFNYDPGASEQSRIHLAETMAYYHTTQFDNYIRQLGLPPVSVTVPVVVYNAEMFGYLLVPISTSYNPATRSISLAATPDGQDSDAMDAYVIVHEYVHACQHELRGGGPGPVVSSQTTASEQAAALAEGLADYAAASRYGSPRFGTWSASIWAHRPFIRNIDNFYRWPGNLVTNSAYPTGMIFSGALWDLRSAAGATTTDTLALKLFQQVADNNPTTSELNTTFANALTALLQVDQDLYGGAHQNTIRQAFAVHGIGTFDFSTPFPMVRDPGNNYDGFSVYSVAGAPALAITFDHFVTKLDDLPYLTDELPRPVADAKATSDWLTILNASDNVIGNFTGRQLQGATIIVPGDTAKFHLTTDGARAPFGYRVVDITTDLSNRELVLAAGEGVVVPLEAASKDLGSIPDAWRESATIGTLTVGTSARVGWVRVVDAFANHPGGKPEALYVHNLTIAEGSKLDLAGLHLYINGTFANAGTLDIATGPAVIDYSAAGSPNPLADIRRWITQAANYQEGTPTWDGKGITSSAFSELNEDGSLKWDPGMYAIGYADNGEMDDTIWPYWFGYGGESDPLFGNVTPVAVPRTVALVKFTFIGDLTLDGRVDDIDATILSNYYNNDPAHPDYANHQWCTGDILEYDGTCNDNDVTAFGNMYGFGTAYGDPTPPPPAGPIPEPATLLLVALGILGVARGCGRH